MIDESYGHINIGEQIGLQGVKIGSLETAMEVHFQALSA